MKKLVIITSMIVLVFSFAALVSCQSAAQETRPVEEKIASTPSLQPAGHEGRYEAGGAAQCYGCHGAGSLANPMLTGTSAIPENHYLNSSYESQVLSVDRLQCITCHPVA